MKTNNFKAFAADESGVRSYLRGPIAIPSGIAYTNGHIAVISLGAKDESAFLADDFLKNALEDIAKNCASANTNWLACPEVEAGLTECKDCNGTGKSDACPECGGSGSIEVDTDFHTYEVDCKTCETQSDHKCIQCYGRGFGGRMAKHPEVLLSGVPVNPAYVKKIFDNLVNPVLAPRFIANLVLFKFDGGVGALMPLRDHRKSAPELIKE